MTVQPMIPTNTPGLPLPLSGKTRLFAILGDPIAQVGSPSLFGSWFRAHGIEAVLIPAHVAPENLPVAVKGLWSLRNLDGLVITVPHKVAMAGMVDELTERARRIGAVNAVRQRADGTLEGDHFDGEGFVRAVHTAGHALRDKRVLQIGCGGAGRAVADAIAEQGPAVLALHDFSVDSRDHLMEGLRGTFAGLQLAAAPPDATGYDVIVNCTPLGLKADDPLPVPAGSVSCEALVVDIVPYAETPLLAAARSRGCSTLSGLAMLASQVDAICAFFGLEGS